MLPQAEAFLGKLVGVGLDSTELGNPPSLFQEVFEKAEKLGLKRVAHAGGVPQLSRRADSIYPAAAVVMVPNNRVGLAELHA